MRTQKCGGCGAMLDIRDLQKGSKFACSNCATVLTVGEAVAARKSFQGSGPAFQPRAQGTPAEKEVPKPSRRAARAEEGRGRARPEGRSRTPLYAGAGALALLGVILAAVFSGGGEKGGAGGPAQPGAGPGPAAAEKLTPEQWWKSATSDFDGTPKSLDASGIRSILRDARARGFDRDGAFWKPKEKELYGKLLEKAPNDADANRYAGRKSWPKDLEGFGERLARMQAAFAELPPEAQKLVRELEDLSASNESRWLDAKTFEERKAAFEDAAKWLDELESDPYAPAIQKGINLVRADPVLKDFEAYPMKVPPFIVFLGIPRMKKEDATPEEREAFRKQELESAKERAKTIEPIYRAYVEEFERRYRKPLDLPAFKPTDVLYQFVFNDREALNRYQQAATGSPLQPYVGGYFSPQNRWVFLDWNDETQDKADQSLNTMAHETTHQLHWFFARDPKDRARNYFDELRAVWFTEGWAEFAGGSSRIHPETRKPEFNWFCMERVDWFRQMKAAGLPLLPIQLLVQREDYMEYQDFVRTWFDEVRDSVPEKSRGMLQPLVYLNTLYAQGWLLVYHLDRYGNGKYRAGLLDLVATGFRGRFKPEKYRKDPAEGDRWRDIYAAFVDIFGVKSEADWARMQKEYEETLAQVLRDAPVRKHGEPGAGGG